MNNKLDDYFLVSRYLNTSNSSKLPAGYTMIF
jgi:hypothetical protein